MNQYNESGNYAGGNINNSTFSKNILNYAAAEQYEPIYETSLAHLALSDELTKQKNKQTISKRAAQNRAAQKAFRQRKDQHIKDLENKARLLNTTEANLNLCKKELYNLKNRLNELEEENNRLRKILQANGNSKSQSDSAPISQKNSMSPNAGDMIVHSSENELAGLFDLKSHRIRFTSILPIKLMDPESPYALNDPDGDGIDKLTGSLDSIQLNSSLNPISEKQHDILCNNCNNPTNSPICLCPRPIVQFPLLAGRRFKWMRSQNRQGLWRWYKPEYNT